VFVRVSGDGSRIGVVCMLRIFRAGVWTPGLRLEGEGRNEVVRPESVERRSTGYVRLGEGYVKVRRQVFLEGLLGIRRERRGAGGGEGDPSLWGFA